MEFRRYKYIIRKIPNLIITYLKVVSFTSNREKMKKKIHAANNF